jgi:hypothetical protein
VKKSEWIKELHGDCMGEHVIQSSWEVSVYVLPFACTLNMSLRRCATGWL